MGKIITHTISFITGPREFIRQRLKLPLIKFIYDTVDLYKTRTKTGVNNIRDILFRGTVVAFITALLVWLSIFMYIAFYYAYVPVISHERPVYLKFRSCQKGEKSTMCSFPAASIQLTQKQRFLMSGQPYRIFLDLEMPESHTNKELGMFMVCADFYGSNGKIVTSSCRSTMLHYKSVLVDTIDKLVFLPFYIFGYAEEKQNIHVELFSSYEEKEDLPITHLNIEIQTRHVEIYSAKFSITANFMGLRYVMFHWPVLSAAIGITSNLFFIAIVCMISWYQIINSEEYNQFLRRVEQRGNEIKTIMIDDKWNLKKINGRFIFNTDEDNPDGLNKFSALQLFNPIHIISGIFYYGKIKGFSMLNITGSYLGVANPTNSRINSDEIESKNLHCPKCSRSICVATSKHNCDKCSIK